MRRLIVGLLFLAAFSTTGATQAPQATGVTVFEGARLIVGDGAAPIENSVFIVANNRFTQVGRRGQVNVPAGAARVDLTGKTVTPAIVDAHTHMPVTRDALVDALQRKAYYGAGVVMSLGQGYRRCGVPGPGRNHTWRRPAAHGRARNHDA